MSEDTIEITVKFFANLREYGPEKAVDTYPKGSQVKQIIERYKIPKEVQKSLIILINGIPHKTGNSVLHDGDLVSIFPPIGGG